MYVRVIFFMYIVLFCFTVFCIMFFIVWSCFGVSGVWWGGGEMDRLIVS